MKDRGKAVEISDSFTSDPPCRKHPSSSSVGICSFCLKDRLIKLVCSDCGEPRLSSCSCSDISNRNSVSVDVGSVSPVSVLIHNEKAELQKTASAKFPWKRSSSTSASEKRNSFWHLGWFSKKKSQLGFGILGRNSDVCRRRSEIWDLDHLGHAESFSIDGKRSVNTTRPCAAGNSFSMERSDLESEDGDPDFFDLKFGRFSTDTKSGLEQEKRGSMLSRGSSCRITVTERGSKGSKRGSKVWKWIFTPSSGRASEK